MSDIDNKVINLRKKLYEILFGNIKILDNLNY